MSPRPFWGLVCLLVPVLVLAQEGAVAPEPRQASPWQAQQERLRIQNARRQVQAETEQANAACYQKFAVNDCLRDVRARNRPVLDALSRQEIILNDLERQAKAIEALKKIEEKSLGEVKGPPANVSGSSPAQ
jgi:hypothetical protein